MDDYWNKKSDPTGLHPVLNPKAQDPAQDSGQGLYNNHNENPVKILLMRTPYGGALFARFPFPEEDGGMQTAIIIHEDARHIQNLPLAFDIQARSVFFEEHGVGLLVVMYKIGSERYETWWNYYNPGMRQSILDLQHQPGLFVMFFEDLLEPSRVISLPNFMQTVFAQFAKRAEGMTPWSMAAFDAARERIYPRYPTLGALWEVALEVGQHPPP